VSATTPPTPQQTAAPATTPKAPPELTGSASTRAAVSSQDPAGLAGTREVAGRYHVVRYIGQTSAAWVYRAIHTGLGVGCFLKVAEKDPTQPQGVPERLRREAKASANVRHPAMLRVYDAGTWEGIAYLSQEWVEGPTLRDVINRGSVVTVPETLSLALEILDAIATIHRKGIVIRAFEPERIFVKESGERREPKLFDLSRTHFLTEGGPPPAAERAHASKGGMGIVVQSARYLSPEEIKELPPDPRSDLYSFGLLLYEMLTGEFPYAQKSSSPTAYLVQHLREMPRPLALPQERGKVPEDLPAIIRKLLAKKPEDRFESADAARRALEDTVIPDLVRHAQLSTSSRVLDGWRARVRTGLLKTRDGFVAPVSDDGP
jgi:serine/threonine-protein kinase